MHAQADREPDDFTSGEVLAQASCRAAEELGLTRATLAAIVGRHRSRLRDELDPDSKSGECALLFVRVYRGLFALLGGDRDAMRAWVAHENRGTGGVPAEQMTTVDGLVRVLGYVDGMRGRL